MNDRRRRGALAEDAVAQAMQRQNWRVLARNYRHTGFELDIVALKAETLVAVEVKYRKCFSFEVMEALLPHQKCLALERGLLYFARRGNLTPRTLRIDLALVTKRADGSSFMRYWAGVTRDGYK